MVKLVKYKNRKIYFPTLRGYVTQTDILELIKGNTPFIVEDHKTKIDITDEVLASMLPWITKYLDRDQLEKIIRENAA